MSLLKVFERALLGFLLMVIGIPGVSAIPLIYAPFLLGQEFAVGVDIQTSLGILAKSSLVAGVGGAAIGVVTCFGDDQKHLISNDLENNQRKI